MSTNTDIFYATGKRKSAVARVYLSSGTGKITVNGREFERHFSRATDRMIVEQPFCITDTVGKFDLKVFAAGGGTTGQAGAVKHGISKALLLVDSELRAILKKQKFLTRDDRIKERKKYGLKGARARFQFSKR